MERLRLLAGSMPADVNRLAPYRAGLKAGVGFALAAIVLGVSFGVLAEPIMGPVAPVVMSAVLFAGAAQFGATAVLAAGGDAITAIAAGTMLERALPADGRGRGHGAARVAAPASGRGSGRGGRLVGARRAGRRPLRPRADDRRDDPAVPGLGGGTLIGVLGGSALGDPAALGLDAIFPAFFVGLLAAELSRPRALAAALLGGAIALALTPVLPPGLPVLLASAAALIGLWGER